METVCSQALLLSAKSKEIVPNIISFQGHKFSQFSESIIVKSINQLFFKKFLSMSVESRIGVLEEVLQVNEKITEWDSHFSKEHFESFLKDRESLIVIACLGGNPIGFMVGFIEGKNFKRWVSGVDPSNRGKGAFHSMHDFCLNWANDHGLSKLLSDVALRRRAMIELNMSLCYKVTGFEFGEDLPNSRLFFEKSISE